MNNPKLVLALFAAAVLLAVVAVVFRFMASGEIHGPAATVGVVMMVLGESYRRKALRRDSGSRA